MAAQTRDGSRKFRLANWGREQRSGSRSADYLLLELTALCNTSHRCTLSDSGIARYFDLKKRSVSRHLGILRARGLIKVHFEGPGRTDRVITFCIASTHGQFGAATTPEWLANQRQNGGQNHKLIESVTGRSVSQVPRPAPLIHPNASPVEAMLAYREPSSRSGDG